MSYSVVWFKRDLRLHDHAALSAAAARGPVLCLFVVEPSLWQHPDAAAQHLAFALESAQALDQALRQRGGRLHLRVGELTQLLGELLASAPFDALFSHEETGNDPSYQRDKAVGAWCQQNGVAWQEFAQFGVVRRLQSRNHWQRHWEQHMAAPVLPAPDLRFAPTPWTPQPWPLAHAICASPHNPTKRQRGGRSEALSVLSDFLDDRCGEYRGGISSPLSAPSACSRLSPYLAWGCLSMREVVQATQQRITALSGQEGLGPRQRAGLVNFVSRLHWHCHFIQKLESEPELEWRNLHRGYDGLREADFNEAHFEALVNARTGWPMVDACVVMLRETGWLNFRMRAMLVSVAAYPLWLHWRPVGLWLARQFLDYEPGIHWSQLQMQSGTTGINTTRVYNPIKQAQDHDPKGHFVRRWLPAMRKVPDTWLFEPWHMPPDVQERCGVRVGVDISLPVVDLNTATREGKARLHRLRAQPEVKAAKAPIVDKHGSRKVSTTGKGSGRSKARSSTAAATPASSAETQLTLGF
jgi:deoxyribodipyrimidine photo-lyase